MFSCDDHQLNDLMLQVEMFLKGLMVHLDQVWLDCYTIFYIIDIEMF